MRKSIKKNKPVKKWTIVGDDQQDSIELTIRSEKSQKSKSSTSTKDGTSSMKSSQRKSPKKSPKKTLGKPGIPNYL